MRPYSSAKVVAIACACLFSAGLIFYAQPLGSELATTTPEGIEVLRLTESNHRLMSSRTAPYHVDLKSELVVYPNPQVAYICGPQLRSGSSLNPYPWFDRVASEHGHLHGRNTPRFAPRELSGTVNVQRGSTEVAGAATRFLTEVDPNGPAPLYDGWLRVKMADGKTYREVKVSAVNSNTRLMLAAPWAFDSVTAASADTFHHDAKRGGWNYDAYYDANYYDLALTQYINYYRTREARFLEYARKTADAWWHSPHISDGTVTSGPNHLPPRSMAFAGLMLRALDGRPEMWDYLEREVKATFNNWVYVRKNNPTLYYDIREDGYAQLYAVMLAKVLPDTYPLHGNGTLKPSTSTATDGRARRRSYLSQTEETAVNFFGLLQRPDGSWRWDVDEGSNPAEQFRDVEQPFMVGLYLESAILLHEQTGSEPVRASLRAQIVKACRHLFRDGYRGAEVVSDMPKYRWRGMWYYWGGGNASNPVAYARGQGQRLTRGDSGVIRQIRHLNSTTHHAFGAAYLLTNDPEFLRMGDEVFDASFGEKVDGLHGLADEGRAKNYAMNFRASGRYLVSRLTPGSGRKSTATPPTTVQNPTSTTHQQTDVAHEAPASTHLIANAVLLAVRLSKVLMNKEEIENLITQIENTQRVFTVEKQRFVLPDSVMKELAVALTNARTAYAIAGDESGTYDTTRLRLEWVAARLKRANELLKVQAQRQ